MADKDKKVVPVDLKLAKAVEIVAQGDAGRVLLAHLATRCGFFESSLSRRADGEIAPLATDAKEAQRLIWIELRRLLTPELRHAIEAFAEQSSTFVAQPQEERKK